MKKTVILISGRQGSGKSTLGAELRIKLAQDGRAVEMINFADPLYEMHNRCRQVLYECGFTDLVQPKDGNLLQLLGTEWGRKTIGENVWVKTLIGKVEKRSIELKENGINEAIFVVCDCRFPNELAAFESTDVKTITIRLECDKETRRSRVSMWRENDNHPSEVGLDGFEHMFDHLFWTNDGKWTAPEIAKTVCEMRF